MKALALTVAVYAGLVASAHAQNRCPQPNMPAIAGEFGETLHAAGLSSSGQWRIELWRADETGTWTLIAVHTSGMRCLVSSGSDWGEVVPPHPRGGGDPA